MAFALGLAWFLVNGGGHALVPTHVDWVAQNDWSQHYLGWAYFRRARWSWPLGSLPDLAEPMGCNLAFSDSAPLVSVLLRPLVAWCAAPVQFIGPFIATAMGLQGLWAARLARRLGGNATAQLAFAALLVSFPPLLHRIDHDTLTSHWVLLASFLWVLGPARPAAGPWRFVAGVIFLATFVAGTHPYLLAMVWPLLFAATVLQARRRNLTRGAAYASFAALGPGVLAALSAFGYLDDAGSRGDSGYRFFAANLVAWVNPEGWSRLLPDQPVWRGQAFEGFAYLGLGGLALLATGLLVALGAPLAAVFANLRRRVARAASAAADLGDAGAPEGAPGPAVEPGAAALATAAAAAATTATDTKATAAPATGAGRPRPAPVPAHDRAAFAVLLAVTGAMALVASSDLGRFREATVWDLTAYTGPLEPLMRTFRSSGRFAWPLSYLALVWGAASVLRRLPRRAAAAVLSLAAALELADVRPQNVATRFRSAGLAQLRDPRWSLLGDRFEALTQVPLNIPNSLVRCGKVSYPNKYELALGFLAVRHGMRINSAYTARVNDARVAELCVEQLAGLAERRPFSPRHLYVVAPAFLSLFTRPEAGMRCGVLDGYHVCVAAGAGAFAAAL